ncbi:MAG TPA: hypothetical protein PKO06_12880 [Candidatus Ozemobacteraceae bacterium]|nr:hypothetical protein [Candidatus Ozemobacteraceae bacterium]
MNQKFSDATRELSSILFHQTGLPSDEVARLLAVPVSTLKRWWQKETKPPHRGGSGTKPVSAIEALQTEIAALRIENAVLREKLTSKESNPIDNRVLIDELKNRMRETIPTARLGEVATAIKTMIEVQKDDGASGDEARIIEYHIPAGEERPPIN